MFASASALLAPLLLVAGRREPAIATLVGRNTKEPRSPLSLLEGADRVGAPLARLPEFRVMFVVELVIVVLRPRVEAGRVPAAPHPDRAVVPGWAARSLLLVFGEGGEGGVDGRVL